MNISAGPANPVKWFAGRLEDSIVILSEAKNLSNYRWHCFLLLPAGGLR